VEPRALGLDSDADAAAVRARDDGRVPAADSAAAAGLVPADALAASPLPPAIRAAARAPDGIDWASPPYTVGGLVRLVLEGEDPATITREEMDRRLGERQALLMRRARSVWDLDFTDYRRAARAVFDCPPILEAPPSPST
jgi:hypothetical protein